MCNKNHVTVSIFWKDTVSNGNDIPNSFDFFGRTGKGVNFYITISTYANYK
jgi:hypothetical protein